MIQRSMLMVAVLVVAGATLFSGSATASQTIQFSDQMTTNLVYADIREVNDSIISGQTLYGGIGTSGEALTFEAENFRLESNGGVGALDGRLSFSVGAKRGSVITGLRISEGGRAQVFGADSFANVHLGGFVTINGQQSAAQQASYTLFGSANGLENAFWDESVEFEFGPTHRVSVDFDNALFAFATGSDGYAFIDKKSVLIEVRTRTVHMPEPSSALALVVCGFAGSAVRRRRRS
jgi:hypothetical protein